jgi:hypothetical protein
MEKQLHQRSNYLWQGHRHRGHASEEEQIVSEEKLI